MKSYKETSILLCLCARNKSGIEAIIVYCPWFFLTTGDTQAEGDGKMNGSSSSSTVLPPHLKEHERPPLLVNCEVSLLHGKMLLIPWKYCGWDAQSQPEIAGNFFLGLRSLSLYPWWSFIPDKLSHYWASLILALTEPEICSCLIVVLV